MPRGKEALACSNIAAERIINADSLSEFISRGPDVFYIATENEAFDLIFDFVIELISIRSEDLMPFHIRIVGCGNHNPGVRSQAAVTYATPGVGSGPIKSTSTPMERMPEEMAFSSM